VQSSEGTVVRTSITNNSRWTRFSQGIQRDFHRGIDRFTSLHDVSWHTFSQRPKVILLFVTMSLFVAIVICVSGIQLPLPIPPMNTLFGALLGFISGWGLFEMSEYRRRRRQQRTIREALKAELRNMERVWLFRFLSSACVHAACSFTPCESAFNSSASKSTKRQ
jgi:hypothetical protein